MKNFIIISALSVIAGCSNKTEQIDYWHTPLPSKGFSIPTMHDWERPPLPTNIRVPSAPSDSIVTSNPYKGFTPALNTDIQIMINTDRWQKRIDTH